MEIVISDIKVNNEIYISSTSLRVSFKGEFNSGTVYGLLLEVYFFSECDENNRRVTFIVGNKASENGQMVVPAFCLKPKEKLPDVNFGLKNGFHPICIPIWNNGIYLIKLTLVSIQVQGLQAQIGDGKSKGFQEQVKILNNNSPRIFLENLCERKIPQRPVASASELFIRSLRPDFPIKDEKPKKNEKLKEERGGESQGKETFIADELTKDITEEEFQIKTFQEEGIRQRKNK